MLFFSSSKSSFLPELLPSPVVQGFRKVGEHKIQNHKCQEYGNVSYYGDDDPVGRHKDGIDLAGLDGPECGCGLLGGVDLSLDQRQTQLGCGLSDLLLCLE